MSTTQPVEVVTAAQVTAAQLKQHADAINERVNIITGHEAAFEDATLEHRLCIGRELACAKAAFGMTVQDGGKLGGRPSKETLSPGDKVSEKPIVLTASPLGFSNWLAREVPDFKRAKADLYINAFHALGLSTEEANPKLIREKIKALNHRADRDGKIRPTLKSLYKLGRPKPPEEPLKIEPPKDSAQLRLEDARESIQLWKDAWNSFLSRGQLDDLDLKGVQDLKEFLAGCRDQVTKRLR